MKKGKIHFFRLLFSAIIGLALFYVAAREIFLFFWNFDLILERHWMHIWNKWQDGWVIKTPREIGFVVAVLLLIPSYFFLWYLVYVFPLKKILLFPFSFFERRKKAKLLKQSLEAARGPSNLQESLQNKKPPEKTIKISAKKMHKIDQLRGKQTSTAIANVSEEAHQNIQSRPLSKKPTKEDEAVSRFDLWEELANHLEEEKLFILRQMKVKNIPVNTFVITQEALFLLFEGPSEGDSWEVKENSIPPVWQTESGNITSPLRAMVKAKTILQNYFSTEQPQYAELNINCCMILDHGNVVNTDDLLSVLEEWDISVLRMGSCKTAVLPDTTALIEYIKSQPASSEEMNDNVAIAILDLMEVDENI